MAATTTGCGLFHARTATGKARSPSIERLAYGTTITAWEGSYSGEETFVTPLLAADLTENCHV